MKETEFGVGLMCRAVKKVPLPPLALEDFDFVSFGLERLNILPIVSSW